MTLEELSSLLNELYAAGSCAVVYSHGENLIRKDFHEFASMIHERAMYQTLMTNGFYIRTPQEAAHLRACGVNRVLISLDSSVREEHDKTRGQIGAYDIALGAAVRLKEAGIPTVGFSTTIDYYNYHRVPEIITIAKQLGLDAISFMQNRYNRPGVFDRNQWVNYVHFCHQLYELMLENRGVVDLYTHDPFMLTILDERLDDPQARENFIGANICNVATGMVSIDPVGNVTGCNFIEEVIGNVREEPFKDIWDRLVLRYSDTLNTPTGPCASCNNKPVCMGGCKAFHYNAKYDERCGETRFGENEPHGLPSSGLPLYPIAPLTRKAGEYVGSLSRTKRR
jgi:radical SAM protein with 4Fe4S-binding SPASM domain